MNSHDRNAAFRAFFPANPNSFLRVMRLHTVLFSSAFLAASPVVAREAAPSRALEPKPSDPYFEKYVGWKAPEPKEPVLKKGDRLAICGDSITEQRMYSLIMETWLTVCAPELEVSCRQYGWSGERADGFLARMKNDVLRFEPTVATTCYGMNDHRYVPYEEGIAGEYRKNMTAVVKTFKEAGVRVVVGSPGTIGLVPSWVKSARGTAEDLNLHLMRLRNIGVEVAEAEQTGFADVFWPMLTAGFEARQKYGKDYMITGKDGVHPGWAGQTVMAYAFLKALGVDGEIATIHLDAASGRATVTGGHELLGASQTEVRLKSRKWPFCAAGGDVSKDDNIRSAMALIPFNETLNRFTLKVANAPAEQCEVTWGGETRTYSSEALAKGVNLAEDFHVNPFTPAFEKVWKAVAAKQEYETRQVKQLFHGPEGAADMALTAALTERVRARLVKAVAEAAAAPVEHAISIKPAAAK